MSATATDCVYTLFESLIVCVLLFGSLSAISMSSSPKTSSSGLTLNTLADNLRELVAVLAVLVL